MVSRGSLMDRRQRDCKNERWTVGFSSLVRIELKDGTSHEDVGFGQADGQRDLGAALEQAKKVILAASLAVCDGC